MKSINVKNYKYSTKKIEYSLYLKIFSIAQFPFNGGGTIFDQKDKLTRSKVFDRSYKQPDFTRFKNITRVLIFNLN